MRIRSAEARPRRQAAVVASFVVWLAVALSAASCAAFIPEESRAAVPSATTSPSLSEDTSLAAPPNAGPVKVAVVGDSNSTGFSGTLEAGVAAKKAWVALMPESDFVWVGGWAHDGATSTQMAEQALPVAGADLVLIMAGTNNIAVGMPGEALASDLEQIVEVTGARSVGLIAIPPLNPLPQQAIALNAELAQLAHDRSWMFFDPWADLRTSEGMWEAAYLSDGVHTTAGGYQQMAWALAGLLDSAPPR